MSTKKQLRHFAQCALFSEYGFKPAAASIILLEASGDGTYILFKVGDHEYRFQSYAFPDGSVWVGPGHIDQIS